MSIYATFFTLAEDEEHERNCARYRPVPESEQASVFWFDGTESFYDPTEPCTCDALGGPFRYHGSGRSITGPDHERDGVVMCCRAVGTYTLRLGVQCHEGDATVLLDRRQVEAMRDALTRFLERWDDPADYEREDAYDAELADTPERLALREQEHARLDEALMEGLKAVHRDD